jgi:threonine-phosphate decarboxylase
MIGEAHRKNVRVLVDESFVDFRSDARDYTVRPLVGTYDNLIVVQSLTKFFAIPGLRLGFAVTAPRLAEKLEAAKDPWNTNLLAQAAGVAALGDGEYQKKTLEWLGPEREYMYRSLSEFEGIKAYRPTVNFIFLRLSPEWENSSVFCERMKGKRILIRNCSNYPGLDDTYVRVAVKTREENKVLLDAFRRIREERE